jgi:uncharacterized membrane protein YoaK (UPF0700 family)
MLRHFGERRTATHNLRLAILLCLTAGFVNAAGFLGFSALTTNVTGHAALLAERIALRDWNDAGAITIWMLLFLAGAFSSSLIISRTGKDQRFSYVIPILLEIVILLACAMRGFSGHFLYSDRAFAGSLLFAMGLQNALVSVISGSVVRTTHLTGTFTDLGIDLAQLKFNSFAQDQTLFSRIKLRLAIIFCFILGALVGAYLFGLINFIAFFAPILLLVFALGYDIFRLNIKRYYANIFRMVKENGDER